MKVIFCVGLLLYSIGITIDVYAQEKLVSGKVCDIDDNPIKFATILVQLDGESKASYGAITDSNGTFKIESIPTTELTLSISHIGYEPYQVILPNETDGVIGKVVLKLKTTHLVDVTIAANKPGIHYDHNKTIYVPEKRGLKDATSGFDILRKVPKVRIRAKDYQVKVGNSSNVLMLINGTSSSRSIFSINPKEIEKVELIQNPGAEYESDITSVINIVLKKDNKGLYTYINGEYSLFNEVNNSAVQLVYNASKTKIYGGYRLSHYAYDNIVTEVLREDKSLEYRRTYQSLSEDGTQKVTKHIFNTGVDIQPSEKIMIQLSGSFTPSDYESERTAKHSVVDGEEIYYGSSERLWINAFNQTYNANYTQHFKNKNQFLEVQNSVRIIDRDRSDKYEINLTSEIGSDDRLELTDGNWLTFASKFSYNNTINYNLRYRTGAHLQLSTMEDTYTTNNSSSKMEYSESRTHLFGSLEYSKNRFSIKTSFGGERRDIDIYDGTIKNTQWYFLPMVSSGFKLNEQNSLSLSYNRRLSYPFYYMLVPFQYYSADSLSVTSGNPSLRPVLHDVVKFTHDLEIDDKDFYMTSSVFYTHSNDRHDIRYANNNGVLYSKWVNVGYSKSIGASVESYFYLFDCLDVTLEGTSYYVSFSNSEYNGLISDFYAGVDAELPWDLKLSVEAYVASKEYDINGYYYHNPYFDSISLSKRLFNNKGQIKLVAINPFGWLKEKEEHWDDSFTETLKIKKQATALSVRLTYTFNSNKGKRTYQKMLLEEQPLN